MWEADRARFGSKRGSRSVSGHYVIDFALEFLSSSVLLWFGTRFFSFSGGLIFDAGGFGPYVLREAVLCLNLSIKKLMLIRCP